MGIVAVTGSSGYIGTRLLQRMEEDPSVERVVGIDLKPPSRPFSKLEFHRMDVRDPGLADLFRRSRADTVVHLAFVLNPIHDTALMHDIDVGGARNVLAAAAACGAEQLVVASSSSAFGAFPDNPPFLTEEHPPRRRGNFTYADDKCEVEWLLGDFMREHPEVRVAVVRPCIVYGPNVDNYLSRFILRLPFLPAISRCRPDMQFVHEDDAAAVFLEALRRGAHGFFHACGEGTVNVEEIADIAGKRLLPLPARLAYPAVDLLWKMRFPLIEGPSGMLDFIRYRWVISDEITRRELGVSPRYTSSEVVRIMVETHRKSKRAR